MSDYPISQVYPSDKRSLAEIDLLLQNEGITRDANLDYICAMRDGNDEIIATGSTEPLNTMNISDSTLQAVKKGMLGYTTNGGSVAVPFQNCVVSAGAKTGTAQIGGSMKNGVFVAFAPYDDPEIAVALVLEKADAGAVLATTAVDIINSYFSREDTVSIVPENHLIP